MGHSKYLDSLSKQEYVDLTKRLWSIQNGVCFICEHKIDLDIQPTNIDHIKPLANGGKDDISNFAVTHEHCNKSKQDADLKVAKTILRLENIVKDAESKGESPSLQHVLKAYDGAKYQFKFKVQDNKLIYSFDDIGETAILESPIFIDKLSNEKTAYIEVPLEYLYHDTELNPRGLNSSVNLLIKEFSKPNPQLQIALARIDDGEIKLFDGQHKTVAQIMLGVRRIVIRLFWDTDYDRLMATNLAAGKQLKQIAFDKSIVRQLHDSLYAVRLSRYQKDNNLQEDDFSFSEQQIVDYYKGEKGSIKTYIVNSQKNAITRSQDNKLQSYINFEGRGTELPLSYSTFEKTFLSVFINSRTILNTPINYKVEEGLNPRILEKEQAIRICNIIAEELLIDKFNDEIGTYRIENNIASGRGDNIADEHLIACRLFKEEIMYNWIKYLQLLIKNHFAYSGVMYDDENLLQQPFSMQLWENIRKFIINLRELPVWKDRSMSATIFGGKNTYDYWKSIFQTGKTPEGTAVLAAPLNVSDMIR
ncbi:MAG: HNH endonuclease [Lachnospiraceae bacterium]|nr:HNH endonuclease [Lachnospiraceae bacterium]